ADDEEEDPRAELVRRLLEYEYFREAASVLGDSERDRARHHRKGYVPPRPLAPASRAPLETEWAEVWAAALQLAERIAEPEPGYTITGRPVRIEEKFGLILDAVRRSKRVEFNSL